MKRLLVAALCFLSVTPGFAAGKPTLSLEQVIRKVQDQQKRTTSIQADFRQEKELALLARPEVSTGTFAFSKPNNVIWNYDAPKRVQMLITGGVLTTYYPDLNKAERLGVKGFEDRIFKYMGASGAIDELARYFDFTFTDTASNPAYVLDLSPKSRAIARRVRHIKIWIDRTTYLTNRFEYTEGDGDVTRYQFSNIRVNQTLAPSRFVLNLPANVKMEQMKLQ